MRFFARKNSSAGWPFWLLVAAWFFANTPQVGVYEFVSWMGQARHFSHQQRLQIEVAVFFTGQQESAASLAEHAPEKPFLPIVPAEAVLKKIELAVQSTSEVLPPVIVAAVYAEGMGTVPEPRRDEPPHEPPRVSLMDS